MSSPTVASQEYDALRQAADYVWRRLSAGELQQSPVLGIVCGSGLSGIADRMSEACVIPYDEIPGFPKATVPGHGNALVAGTLNGVPTLCLLGRFHYYEGHSLRTVVFPVRMLALLGIRVLLVSNAAGAVDPAFRVGDVMVIEDHISFLNLSGFSALRGENLSKLGPRFPALTNAYHRGAAEIFEQAAKRAGLAEGFIRRGVYVGVGGPSYETPSEINLMRILGGGAVGMSTTPEVVAAAHAGLIVVAFSMISNSCIGREDLLKGIARPTHEEVLEATQARTKDIQLLVHEAAPLLAQLQPERSGASGANDLAS